MFVPLDFYQVEYGSLDGTQIIHHIQQILLQKVT